MPRKVTRFVAHNDPYILLMGCRPWSAFEERAKLCPICHGGIGREKKRLVVCCRCHSVSPTMGRIIENRETGRLQAEQAERARQAEEKARAEMRRRFPVVLDEKTRRLIWNGYRGVMGRESDAVTNLARVGREWLRSIGQEPAWDQEPAEPVAC